MIVPSRDLDAGRQVGVVANVSVTCPNSLSALLVPRGPAKPRSHHEDSLAADTTDPIWTPPHQPPDVLAPAPPAEAWQRAEEWLARPAAWMPAPGSRHRALL